MSDAAPHHATLIPGDGIGPSIAESTVSVIEAAGVDMVWDVQKAGMNAMENGGDPVPKALLDSIRETRVALKGPITTPIGEGFRSVNVALRQEFDLYANLRPCASLLGVRGARPGVDIVIVRENTEGMYAGQELYTGTDRSSAVLVAFNTRKAMLRICRYAFEYARTNHRKRVTAVHKANIMKKFSGILLTCFREIAEEYPDIQKEERIIDATAMEMVRRPHIFDVIVTTNLFGDILSDLVAGLCGGLGVAPGGNYGEQHAVFEAVHGSAPDIAGKNLANPLGLILSANLMLRHIGEEKAAEKIDRAVRHILAQSKFLTPDLLPGSRYGTTDMTKALVDQLPDRTNFPLAVIAGPCVIESESLCLEIAEEFFQIATRTGVLPIFKASFDKANRTSVESFRGPGLDGGLKILAKVRSEIGLPVLTDIHIPEQAAAVAEVVDILQIPAFLCRQTDLLVAAGKTGKPVNIKKGQFLAPEDMRHSAQKVESTGNSRIMLTERGASFGYRELIVDMRSLVKLADIGYPVVFDATHSVQRLGGQTGVSGGAPEFIEPLARAAVATGAVSSVFIETHPRPSEALSDAASMLPLDRLEGLIVSLVKIIEALGLSENAISFSNELGVS